MNELDVAGTYEIDDIAELDIEGLSLDKEDRLFIDNTNKVFAIFRGIDTDDTFTTYTISYTLNNGTAGTPANPTTYTPASSAITLTNPTRTGYTFAGWTGTGLSSATTTVTIPHGSAGNRTYTATWASDDYTIDYTLNGGTVAPANPTTYTVATADFTLTNPTRTGYIFNGWTGTGLTAQTMSVTVAQGSTGNRTYTATWSTEDYTIDYNLNGGTEGAPANPTLYTIATADFTLSNPTRVGYNFVGWTGTDLTVPTMSVTVDQGSTGDRTYTANWQTVQYSIIYTLNDVNATNAPGNPANYTIETATITLADPTTTSGTTFAGWTGEGITIPTKGVTIPLGSTGGKTFTANWGV
jgi:uncharacterized repeat protein (TIGR02543 family)